VINRKDKNQLLSSFGEQYQYLDFDTKQNDRFGPANSAGYFQVQKSPAQGRAFGFQVVVAKMLRSLYF